MSIAGTTVSASTQTIGFSQLIVAIPLALSLKSLWFLMNMMQVVAYLRHIEHLPANVETILESLDDAIGFKFIF